MILKEFTSNDAVKFTKLTQALNESNIKINWETMDTERADRVRAQALTVLEENKNTNRRMKMKLVLESLELWMKANTQTELTDPISEAVDEESVESAKVIIAAKDISDKLQGMIEDVAQLQVQDLLPIADSMRTELGTEEANTFSSSADAALGSLLDTLKNCKEEYDNAIAVAQGESSDVDMDMELDDIDAVDPDVDDEVDMDLDLDSDDDMESDEFDLDLDDEDIDAGRELK